MRYVRPDLSLNGSAVSGTVDADYDNDWLVDGRPAFPVRVTGSFSLTVTPAGSPAPTIDVIALIHHNVRQAATVTLGGDLSSTIPTVPEPPDGIFPNIYRLLSTPDSVSSLVLGISGNTVPVITSLYAGLSRELTPLHLGRTEDPAEPFQWEGEGLTQAPYDPGVSDPWRSAGECILTDDELEDVRDWYLSTRRGTRPTLIILDDAINEAKLVVFRYKAVDLAPAPYPDALHTVSFEFVEIPRVRW